MTGSKTCTHKEMEYFRMDRKEFLITANIALGAVLAGSKVRAAEVNEKRELMGVLVDTTRCMGCRSCEYACAEANGLPEPEEDEAVFDNERTQSETQWSVVNRYETDLGEVFVKKQCMHCMQPACAAACLTKAMYKSEEGPVIWREKKCMGCRFCMISCPFDIPKFEYHSAVPKLHKCQLCLDRIRNGEQPACVENCLGDEALVFGKRSELIEIARKRIFAEPGNYVNHVYGEHEVGGTGMLYLASVPFDKLGFRNDLGSEPYPALTRQFLYTVPVVITLLPPFLLAISHATKREQGKEKSEE